MGEVGDAVVAQAAVQARARDGLVDEFVGDRQEIVEEQDLAQLYHEQLLPRGKIGVPGVGSLGGVLDEVAPAPLAHRDGVEVIAPGKRRSGRSGGLQLAPDRRRGSGVLV